MSENHEKIGEKCDKVMDCVIDFSNLLNKKDLDRALRAAGYDSDDVLRISDAYGDLEEALSELAEELDKTP